MKNKQFKIKTVAATVAAAFYGELFLRRNYPDRSACRNRRDDNRAGRDCFQPGRDQRGGRDGFGVGTSQATMIDGVSGSMVVIKATGATDNGIAITDGAAGSASLGATSLQINGGGATSVSAWMRQSVGQALR